MLETPRMGMPYPTKDTTDWFDDIKTFFLAADAHTYAHREDRNLVMYSGATWTWDAGTSQLVWDASFYFTGAQTGGRWKIDAGNISIPDGYMMVVKLPRYPQGTVTITTVDARAACERDDEGVVVCVRVGSMLYFRNGIGVSSGSSINIFAPGGVIPPGNVEVHQRDMHSNGIVRSSTSSAALNLSVTDNGGGADDDLVVDAVPANDKYYVKGKERTEPSAAFTYTNPAIPAGTMRLYRSIVTDSGDPLIQERIEWLAPVALDPFFVVNCSKGLGLLGAKNLVFTSIVAANYWKMVFDGGPPMLVTAANPLQTGTYRLYSQNGVDWIDVSIDSTFDWTKVDAGSPHTVALTFSAEVDEEDSMIVGSVVEWESGGWVQWGYGTSKDVIDQRYFGNLSEDEIRDDLLKSISERAWINGLNGVVFDRKAYWTGELGAGPVPRNQWPEHNFGFLYSSPSVTIHGGNLFVDGEVVEVLSDTIQLNLTLPGKDYYLWWDQSDGTLKITDEDSFPTIHGVANPLMWILGGSIGLPDYVADDIDKPARGVPLYVFRRGGADNQIDEGTLCDLRRNVTKAALKNHISVGFRADWQTAGFQPVGNVPDINQSESEFGCLDAAFRYIGAIPAELGTFGSPRTGRIIQVMAYTEERKALWIPPDTQIVGCGYSAIYFHPNAVPQTVFSGFDSLLHLPDSSSLKDLLVYADGEVGPRAALALVGETPPCPWSQDRYPKAVIENCTIHSTGQCALIGMTPRSKDKGIEVGCYRSTFYGTNPYLHVGNPTVGAMFTDFMQNIMMEDCVLSGEDYGILWFGGFGTWAKKCQFDRCIFLATFEGGPTGPNWPNGSAIDIGDMEDLIFHDCLISTDHAQAVRLGLNKTSDRVVVDGCVIRSSDTLAGSAVAGTNFVDIRSTAASMLDCFVYGPLTSNTESGMTLVKIDGGNADRPLLFSRNHVELAEENTVSWDYIVYLNGSASPVLAGENNIVGDTPLPDGGLTVGLYAMGSGPIKIEETAVENVAGIGIDVDQQSGDVVVSKCTVDGWQYGNGIRARGLIEGCTVRQLKSWGIHCYPFSKVLNNTIDVVSNSADRTEGPAVYGEYSAWGIRYSPFQFDVLLESIQIKDNDINGVQANVEDAAGNSCFVCGVGPERPPGALDRYMLRCDISGNEMTNITAVVGPYVNTEVYGICLMHPHGTVKCDHNQIKSVTTTAQSAYGVGVFQSPAALPASPDTFDLSISHNAIDYVYAQQNAVGILAGSGSRVSIIDNDISSCWFEQVTGVLAGYIMYLDTAGLGGREEQIEICQNQMGIGSQPPSPTEFSTFGIFVQQGNPAVPLRQVEIVGNQMDADLRFGVGWFIGVVADGEQFVIKKNQHRTEEPILPEHGIFVVPFSTEIMNANISQNEANGEYSVAFIYGADITGSVVHDNQQMGFDFAGLASYGSGIMFEACNDIDVHDNEILYVTPDGALNSALINIIDCIFGDVHDNVLKAPGTAGNRDSLRFEDTSINPPALCDDLHVHDNKIDPHGAAAGPYDIGFYATGGNPAAFGVNMTIWANVFGNPGTTGFENFATAPPAPFYVPAPQPNNWTGAGFV